MLKNTLKPKIKKSVRYRILIKNNNCFFKVGTIAIRTLTGDMLYTPSQRVCINEKKLIDHISWHKNGRVHIKYFGITGNKYNIIQDNDERQKISDIGFQELLVDTIKDYQKMPKHEKAVVDLDVIFDVGNYLMPVAFYFSMVSGKLIFSMHKGKNVPIKSFNIKKDLNGFNVIQRALGWHSGNADVMLQYSLRRVNAKELKTNRRINIPYDMKITKIKKLSTERGR